MGLSNSLNFHRVLLRPLSKLFQSRGRYWMQWRECLRPIERSGPLVLFPKQVRFASYEVEHSRDCRQRKVVLGESDSERSEGLPLWPVAMKML